MTVPTHTRKRVVALSLASALTATFAVGLAAIAPPRALGDTATPINVVTDPATHKTFSQFEIQSGTSASGSVWTDKTVFGQGGVPADVTRSTALSLNPGELGVALGALSSAQRIDAEEKAPVDLVMILDNSYSMTQCVGSTAYCDGPTTYQNSRAYAMVEAVEAAIEDFAAANPANRIALVQFGTGAGELEPLGTPAKIAGTNTYVAFTPPTSNGGAMYMRTASKDLQIGKSGSTVQSTNMQLGLFVGMNILAKQPRATVTGAFQRTPNVLMFTDGEPTYSATANTWWSIPSDSGTQGPGSPADIQFFGNGFKAALTAAYMKNQITDAYNDPAFEAAHGVPRVQTRVFTVGLGLPSLKEQGRNLAMVTLDPKHLLGGAADSMQVGFTNSWATYSGGASVSVSVAANDSFNVTHPTGAAAKYDPTDLKYNDAFFAPNTMADLAKAFDEITQQIVNDAPVYPIQVEDGEDATASGYVTFTDPLGPFMRVTDMSRLSFCSLPEGATSCVPWTSSSPTTKNLGSGVTQYTFSGTYTAVRYAGPQSVANIIVTVQRFTALSQGDIVTVRIPAALLPQVVTTVTLNADDKPVSLTTQASQPVYVVYKVAPKAGVVDALSNPATLTNAQDRAALAAYVTDHMVGGQIRFFSDDYAGATGSVQALTTASFTPATSNTFYRFGADTTLYADGSLSTPLTKAAWDGMAATGTVWYGVTQYVYTDSTQTTVKQVTTAFSSTKGQLQSVQDATHQIAPVTGVMTVPAGMEDTAKAATIDSVKCQSSAWSNGQQSCPAAQAGDGNLTATAAMDRLTSVTGDTVLTSLGNNGYLAYAVPGRLAIDLTVQAAAGLVPNPATPFPYTVDLKQAGANLTGTFAYEIFDSADLTTPIGSPGTIASGGTVSLKASQTVVIYGLPDGTAYTVTQGTLPTGYTLVSPVTPSSGVHTGSISSGETAQAPFVDAYAAESVTVDAPTVTVQLAGRDWKTGDDFTARLCPSIAATPVDCVTVPWDSTPRIDAGDPGTAKVAAQFDPLTFSAPGTYTYLITEVDDGSVPGLSYSGAVYEWQVVVADNGLGHLTASTSITQLVDDQGVTLANPAAAAFTNKYTPDDIQGRLIAIKAITDNSAVGPAEDQTSPMPSFEFKYQYLGSVPQIPAPPEGSPPSFSASPPGEAVTGGSFGSIVESPPVTYTSAYVGHSLYFSVAENPTTLPNVTISGDVWVYRVSVSQNSDGELVTSVATCKTTKAAVASSAPYGGCSPASGTYTAIGGQQPVFTNTYDPAPVTATLPTTDSIVGRDWVTGGDSFGFTLTGGDTATIAALGPGGGVTLGATATCPDVAVTGVTATQTVSSPSPFCFGATFTKQGTYRFALTQTVLGGSPTGMTYDTHTAYFEVVVASNLATGQLEAVVTVVGQPGDAVAHFVNRYQASLVFTGVDVTKQLTGRDFGPGEFSFKLTTDDANSCAKAGLTGSGCAMTVTNVNGSSDAGVASLPAEIDLTQADLGSTLTYRIVESNSPALGGVTYDTTAYDVTVKPLYDTATGLMYTETTITTVGATATYDSRDVMPEVAFRNGYTAAPATDVALEFPNTLVGRSWTPSDSFEFTITPVGDAPSPTVSTAHVTSATGPDMSFGSITFTQPGVYEYVVKQTPPTHPLGGVTYDLSPCYVTITVTDDGQGNLVASIDYGDKSEFVNYYGVWVTWDLLESITLVGLNMQASQFDFAMVPDDQASANVVGVPLTGYEWSNAVGRPDGMPETMVAPSPEITLTHGNAGHSYCYTVSQVIPATPTPGITYDSTRYHVCAAVADDLAGRLTVTTVATASSGAVLTQVHRSNDAYEVDPADKWLVVPFVNLYKVSPAQQVANTGGGVTPDAGRLALIALGLMATGAVVLAAGRRREDNLETIDD